MASDYTTYPLVWISKTNSTYPTGYTALPVPSDYKMTISTLVDSARNSKGEVIGQIVREGVRKIELVWNYLTIDQFKTIARLFTSKSYGGVSGSFFNYVRFFDTENGDFVNGVYMYPSDRITDTAHIKLVNGKPVGYENVRLALVEC